MYKQNVKSNMVLQGLYQILVLGIPLITAPYLTRTLGSENLGIYAYTSSVAYYFIIFATLGISRHGQRSIAAASDDETQLRRTFWSLYIVHVFFSILALVFYFAFVALFDLGHKIVFLIQGLYVLSALFDITWLFYGLENFKSVVIKNAFIKCSELICIFDFIHSPSDLNVYTFIMTGSLLAGQMIMLPQAIHMIKPIKVGWADIKRHIKPLLVLSISVIAVSLYTVFDKTLLGLMDHMSSVSYYEYANKILSVPKSLLGVITTVLFPRVCKLVGSGSQKELRSFFNTSFILTAFFGVGAMFLVAGVAKTFAPLYFGTNFSICGEVMIWMSPVVIVVSLGDLIRTQLMISRHKDNQFIFCVIMNAIVNIIVSCLLIKPLGVYGAVAGSLAAEVCGLILESLFCKEDFSIKDSCLSLLPFIIIGVIAVIPMIAIHNWLGTTFVSLIFQALSGGAVYLLISAMYFFLFQKECLEAIKANLR